ncbi:MAG TPA: hypothetical protein VGN16_21200 [Acidobacteriaceae bacterium]|jgi:hypothetical protein
MAQVIQVERDQEGLHEALVGLFEESYQMGAVGSALRHADEDTRERALSSVEPLKLSPGYYTWSHYLLDLGYSIAAGAQYSAEMLTRADVAGLQTLARAKAKFESDHPACSSCGARQDSKLASKCKGCGISFLRAGS